MLFKISAFISLIILSSCSIKGITNDYGKLTSELKVQITPLQDFKALKLDMAYTINAEQLNKEIASHHKVLVYVFTNGCTSNMCKPLFVYENYAKQNGYDLFLVMNGFGNLEKTLIQPRKTPLLAIDGDYYKTIYRGAYERKFMNEISGLPTNQQRKFQGDLFFYSDGKLEKLLWELPK